MTDDLKPGATFRGLPLTSDQEREVEHFIRNKMRCNAPWDTPELQALLDAMLDPPELDEDDPTLEQSTAGERAIALHEELGRTDLLQSEHDQQH